jgi:hypothetical protein
MMAMLVTMPNRAMVNKRNASDELLTWHWKILVPLWIPLLPKRRLAPIIILMAALIDLRSDDVHYSMLKRVGSDTVKLSIFSTFKSTGSIRV